MNGGREDEEVARKRRYWEKFAKEQIKQLFGEPEEIMPQREPLYTAQIGIKYKYNKKAVDTESVATDISLLSMSTIRPEVENKKQKRKRRKRNKELVELLNPSRMSNETPRPADKQGPKWEVFAKERKGLLDRLIQKDKGNLEGFVKGKLFCKMQFLC